MTLGRNKVVRVVDDATRQVVKLIKFRVKKKVSNERSSGQHGYKGRRNEYQTRGQDVSPWAQKFAAVMEAAEKGGKA